MSFLELICFSAASVAVYFFCYAFSHVTPFVWLLFLPVVYFWFKLIRSAFGSLGTRKKAKVVARPVCANGRCHSKDYTLVDSGPGSFTYRCKCGDKYLSQGTYFSRILPNGSMQRYMTLQRSGEWTRDDIAPIQSRN